MQSAKLQIYPNGAVVKDAAGPKGCEVIRPNECAKAWAEITSWPGYAPTPLRSLSGIARHGRIEKVWYKDEAGRFGLGSFKALGGAYAVLRVLQEKLREQTGRWFSSAELRSDAATDLARAVTVTTATDGNHGRAVAWGAQMFGCRAVVYVPSDCSSYREQAIAAYGAKVVRTNVLYDQTVERCAHDADAHGYVVVSDTSWTGYEFIPCTVMHGYTVMVAEVLQQLPAGELPTHVFIQCGVGGLAGAVCGYLWQALPSPMPLIGLVEPEGAACAYASARKGRLTAAPEPVGTMMAGLNCGQVSPIAWPILQASVDAFMTVSDEAVPDAMRLLAQGRYGDEPVVAGESAVAGLIALLAAASDPAKRDLLNLDAKAQVLLFGTEGATDPDLYAKMVDVRQ